MSKLLGSLIFAPPTRRFKPDATSDYEWLSLNPAGALELEPSDLPWPDAPAQNGHQAEPLDVGRVLAGVPLGQRNQALFRLACKLRAAGVPLEWTTRLVTEAAANCSPPWGSAPGEEPAERLVERVYSRYQPNPTLVVVNGEHEFVSPTIECGVGETNSIPDSWLPVPISEVDADTTTTEWLWDQVLAKGHLTDFVGFWKSGKTTLVAALLQRMEHGGELAGRTVRPGKALVISEEPRVKWLERREALNLADHVHVISRPFPKRPNHAEWLAFTNHITRLVAENAYDLAILDSLPNLWPVRDENDAAEVISALLPLQGVASAGCAVLFLRHPRKSDGLQATAGRGSGAISGFADIIVEMRRYVPDDLQDTRRVLTVYSRYEPFEVVIRWHGDGQYETLGSPTAYAAEAQRERLLEALAEGSATTGELAKAVELPHATVSRRLDELAATGRVTRTGTGKKGSPFRWSLANGGDDPDGDGFVSPTNTPIVGETKSDEKHHTWLPEAKNGGHTPDGDGFVSPTNAPIVGETKTDGNHENPHQNCKNGEHDSVGATGETELSHREAKIGEHTPAGVTGETELSREDGKNGEHGCVVCGKPVARWGGRPTRYCSDACRMKAQRRQRSSANTPDQGEPVPPTAERTVLTMTPPTNTNEPRHQKGATGRPTTVVEKTDGGPPDPGICLDCHQAIVDPGFSYRCPRCLKNRLDRLGWQYPPKLADWLERQGNQ
jgi:hypothetical protein